MKRQLGRIDRAAGQPAGIDRLVELRLPAAGDAGAAAIGVRRHRIDGVEIDRQPRGEPPALLLEGIGETVDEADLAASLVAANLGKILAVEPVDDAGQPEMRGIGGEPAHVDDAADIAVGDLVERPPAGLHLGAQCGDIGADHVDDRLVGRRFRSDRGEVAGARNAEQSLEAVALGFERREDRRIVDEGDDAFRPGGGVPAEDQRQGRPRILRT